MGKSERGAIFLDATMTSPYEFYQYWLNDEDELAVQHVRWLTLLGADEVAEIEASHAAAPEKRPAQRALAFDLTARVHGREEAERQTRVAEAVFSGQPLRDPEVLDVLFGNVPSWEFGDDDLRGDPASVAVASGLYPSRSEAMRQIKQGGYSINDERVTDGTLPQPIDGRYLVLRAGKKRLLIGRRRPA